VVNIRYTIITKVGFCDIIINRLTVSIKEKRGGNFLLELNEKAVRKGKALGLPYVGSKKKISKKIVQIIKDNFGTDKTIYDIFGGGGAITAECLLQGLEVNYNDINKNVTDMFTKVLESDRDYLKTLIISRDEFYEIKEKAIKTVTDNLKLLINSFGNNSSGYLYSKQNSELKYNLAKEIIAKHDVFSGYKQTETYKTNVTNQNNDFADFKDKPEKHRILQQLGRLKQLEPLHQVERLERLEQLVITNLSYQDFSYVKDAILYLDPPYENTHDAYGVSFNSQEFYDWAYEMAKDNVVIISSYEISDKRFKCVYSFDNVVSTMQGANVGKKCEKLFMVREF